MKKPAGCLGCPLYGDGYGFVPDEIRPGAPLVIYMQNPGEEEVELAKPAIGKTGQFQVRIRQIQCLDRGRSGELLGPRHSRQKVSSR